MREPPLRHAVGVLKSVIVDAGGVLLLPDPVTVRFVLAEFGAYPNNETCWRAHYEMIRRLDDSPAADWQEMSRLFASALGVLPQYQDDAGKASEPEDTLDAASAVNRPRAVPIGTDDDRPGLAGRACLSPVR